MKMNFDVYSITKLVEQGLPHRISLVEKALVRLDNSLEPFTILENFVFAINTRNGELWRLNYQLAENTVRFYDPKNFNIESDSTRYQREQKKISKEIVEALSENDQNQVDELRAKWMKTQREKYQLENKLNLSIGINSEYIRNARKAVTEAVKNVRSGKAIFKKGINNSTFKELLENKEVFLNVNTPVISENTNKRKSVLYTQIIEARQKAKELTASPVFKEYVSSLYEGTDTDEAIDFIVENYQQLFTLSISEQAELLFNALEKQGVKPELSQVVERVLAIGKYAVQDEQISEHLAKLSSVIGAENGNFHERMQIVEAEVNKRHFTSNDVSVLRQVIEKVLESPSQFLDPTFIVELRKAYSKIVEMVDNNSYDDSLVSSTIHMLSSFYPTQMSLGESKKKEADSEYEKFFEKKMKQWDISSPEDLSDEDKKKFFSEIEKEWDKDDDHGKSDDEDPSDDKNIYNESGNCANCGSPVCLCAGLNEKKEEETEDEEVEDSDKGKQKACSYDELQERFKKMKKSKSSSEQWEELHSDIKKAKKESDDEMFDELEDDVVSAKALHWEDRP